MLTITKRFGTRIDELGTCGALADAAQRVLDALADELLRMGYEPAWHAPAYAVVEAALVDEGAYTYARVPGVSTYIVAEVDD